MLSSHKLGQLGLTFQPIGRFTARNGPEGVCGAAERDASRIDLQLRFRSGRVAQLQVGFRVPPSRDGGKVSGIFKNATTVT